MELHIQVSSCTLSVLPRVPSSPVRSEDLGNCRNSLLGPLAPWLKVFMQRYASKLAPYLSSGPALDLLYTVRSMSEPAYRMQGTEMKALKALRSLGSLLALMPFNF